MQVQLMNAQNETINSKLFIKIAIYMDTGQIIQQNSNKSSIRQQD